MPDDTTSALVDGVCSGDRAALGRAITLVESDLEDDQERAQELLTALLPRTGSAQRVGITGVPGAGKSTLIEALGMHLIEVGHRVAVLAIDPSSAVTGGSILGDKTRMSKLGTDDRAFVRPTPAAGSLGGVARKTREAILLCEAAGYDIVLVETVGVGQSETSVGRLVDTFVLLMLPNAGDELQGIKRGIFELADIIAVNKADGDDVQSAENARQVYASALHYLGRNTAGWTPAVVTCSGLAGSGVPELWNTVMAHQRSLETDDRLLRQRMDQNVDWMWHTVESLVLADVKQNPRVAEQLASTEHAVRQGKITPTAAARSLVSIFQSTR